MKLHKCKWTDPKYGPMECEETSCGMMMVLNVNKKYTLPQWDECPGCGFQSRAEHCLVCHEVKPQGTACPKGCDETAHKELKEADAELVKALDRVNKARKRVEIAKGERKKA